MGILYIVSTPIGNLGDISIRALKILKSVDLVLCEDTRVTKKLLNHYKIETPVLSYHQHSKLKKVNYILGQLEEDKNLALLSDAGTPGIADPGNQLVGQVVESLGAQAKIVPVPGPSALTTAASVAGFPMDRFLFLGFPPSKKKRQKFFAEVVNSKYPVIFFESPYRILKTLKELRVILSRAERGEEFRPIVLCRELSKKFETIYRGTIEQVSNDLEQSKIKGEFVVLVAPVKHE